MNQVVHVRPDISVCRETVADTATRRIATIEDSVRSSLRCCSHRSIAGLQCDCFLSADARITVTLRGHLPSFYLNQLAQELVRHVPGVHQVCNRVEVDYRIGG